MKKGIIGFLILVVVLLIVSGCTTTPGQAPQTATPTAAPEETAVTAAPTVNETGAPELSFAEEMAIIQKRSDENGPISMALNTTTSISLRENPTTGYQWNATVSSGLEIVNDTYSPPETQLEGAGGMRNWVVQAIGLGNQTFTAVYHRPWEPVNETDITFTQKFVVTP
jgi:inhibitor of cysteine peptidase